LIERKRQARSRAAAALLAPALLACGAPNEKSPPPPSGDPVADAATPSAIASAPPVDLGPMKPDFGEDILETDLALDVKTYAAVATISLVPPASGVASFEIGDLKIASVKEGELALPFESTAGRLDVDLRARPRGEAKIVVAYSFQPHLHLDGWDPGEELTFTWPRFCGNLFPCKSDPADGLRFKLDVKGTREGERAIYPAAIDTDAPSYMLAIAIGDLSRMELGKTAAGTRVAVYYRPGNAEKAKRGTAHLTRAFDYLEKTYGPYAFGTDVASVDADWSPGAYGGMEHHPYWHVADDDFTDEYTHAHEAAHGWYGDGVRIACWQDFVLSEGTASYIAARALESAGFDVWHQFSCDLKTDCTTDKNTIALPSGCEPFDLLHDPLWSDVPYMKGAFFYKEVAGVIGARELDAALAAFYRSHVGRAAHMNDLIAEIDRAAGPEKAEKIDGLATAWLRTKACPVDPATLCR
jgi:hypothetical protein